MDDMVGGDLLDHPAATDHFHWDPFLYLGTVGAALAQHLLRSLPQRWDHFSGALTCLSG